MSSLDPRVEAAAKAHTPLDEHDSTVQSQQSAETRQDLEQLRDILFGSESAVLRRQTADLQARVTAIEPKLETVSAEFAALQAQVNDSVKFAMLLQTVIAESIEQRVKAEPGAIAYALASELKALIQAEVNRALDAPPSFSGAPMPPLATDLEASELNSDQSSSPAESSSDGTELGLQFQAVSSNDLWSRSRLPLLGLGLFASLLLVPWGLYEYRQSVNQQVEARIEQAMAIVPNLAIHSLVATADNRIVQLSGQLPSRALRDQATAIAKEQAPNYEIDNDIIVVDDPLAAEVQRIVATLNQIYGTEIRAAYQAGVVQLEGTVFREADLANLEQAFEQVPGVEQVSSNLFVQPRAAATRVYFEHNSDEVPLEDIDEKLRLVKRFMEDKPDLKLRIIGHTSPDEVLEGDSELALERAQAVELELEDLGVDRRRLQAVGRPGSPPSIDQNQPQWLSRTVLFEVF